ncbi:hypothetical protein [Petrachloros mirabilis]
MLLWIWTRNDETGLLDNEFKDGDILLTKEDSFEASIGLQEKKSWLIIKIPDPPNMTTVAADLVLPEYAAGPTPDENVVRRKRRYRLDWSSRFTESEIALIQNANDMLPDGTTAQGGTVAAGVVSGLFTIEQFLRK